MRCCDRRVAPPGRGDDVVAAKTARRTVVETCEVASREIFAVSSQCCETSCPYHLNHRTQPTTCGGYQASQEVVGHQLVRQHKTAMVDGNVA